MKETLTKQKMISGYIMSLVILTLMNLFGFDFPWIAVIGISSTAQWITIFFCVAKWK